MVPRLRNTKWTMRTKLLYYMLLLALILLFALFSGILMLGRFDSASKDMGETLDFQMSVFEKDMTNYFETLAASSIDLSHYVSGYIDNDKDIADVNFDNLTDNPEKIEEIQSSLIKNLSQKLETQNCSGIFVMLNATVNSQAVNADLSRTGVYLHHNRYQSNGDIVMFRGNSAIGKDHGILPHRKWRLEFRTDQFPSYDELSQAAGLPLNEAYMLTESTTLSGTSDNVVLMAVPIVGNDGTFYGICGYEISSDYFMIYHAQPSLKHRITCMILSSSGDESYLYAGLSCSGQNSYVSPPSGNIRIKNAKGNLVKIYDDNHAYVGLCKETFLTPNNDGFTLAVMTPKADYNHAVFRSILQLAILILLLLFFAISCCIFFSKRYLSPILKVLEKAKKKEWDSEQTEIPEIDDLLGFLSAQDKELKQARLELKRLSYSRKTEVDPDNYRMFLEGLESLTPTEHTIFEYYLEGKTVKEIIRLTGVKESTVRFHNRNIYSKLNVTSLKQLLLYAAMMKQTEDED